MLARTIDAVSPGSGTRDALASAVTGPASSERAGEIALFVGLFFALLSMTTAMAQIERGTQPHLRHPRGTARRSGSTAAPR